MITPRKTNIKLTNEDYKILSEYRIYEAQGVNFENVVPEYHRVRDLILYEFPRNKFYIDDTLGVKRKTYNIKDSLFGDEFTFKINVFSFTSYEYDTKKSEYTTLKKAAIDKKNHILYATLTIIDGNLLSGELMNTLGHELHHYFETELSHSKYNEKPLYDIAIEIINGNYSSKQEAYFKQCFGYGLYLSFKEEREGFANGLYARLMDNRKDINYYSLEELCRHDESYPLLVMLRYITDKMEENNFNENEKVWIDDILQITGFKWKRMVWKIKFTHEDFERRIKNIKRLIISRLKLHEDIIFTPFNLLD